MKPWLGHPGWVSVAGAAGLGWSYHPASGGQDPGGGSHGMDEAIVNRLE